MNDFNFKDLTMWLMFLLNPETETELTTVLCKSPELSCFLKKKEKEKKLS